MVAVVLRFVLVLLVAVVDPVGVVAVGADACCFAYFSSLVAAVTDNVAVAVPVVGVLVLLLVLLLLLLLLLLSLSLSLSFSLLLLSLLLLLLVLLGDSDKAIVMPNRRKCAGLSGGAPTPCPLFPQRARTGLS